MRRFATMLTLFAALILIAVGCSNQSNPVLTEDSSIPAYVPTAKLSLSEGSVVTSATFSIYIDDANGQEVTIHRITAPWVETEVTWNSFGGAFAPTPAASFVADARGWKSVDITALVQTWMDGTYENYGFLMKQGETIYTIYYSSERDVIELRPKLEICIDDGMTTECMVIQRGTDGEVADAEIIEQDPDLNSGSIHKLFTGMVGTVRKQSLVRFEISAPPAEEGCTRTIGYWKTHAGLSRGRQGDMVTPLLPIWLGTPDGKHSIAVTSNVIAVRVLSMRFFGHSSNGITKLYAQLLAAKLNIANGATGVAVSDVIADADAFIAGHSWMDWHKLSREDKKMVLAWKDMLDDYNNGRIGPGHCGCRSRR